MFVGAVSGTGSRSLVLVTSFFRLTKFPFFDPFSQSIAILDKSVRQKLHYIGLVKHVVFLVLTLQKVGAGVGKYCVEARNNVILTGRHLPSCFLSPDQRLN